MSLPWAPWPFWLLLWVRRAQGASFQNIQLPLAEEIPDLRIVVKNCDVLKGKHFFRNHLYTNWHFRIPGLALNGSEHQGGQIKPFWWEASPELKPGRSLDGGKVLQRFQQISDFGGSKLSELGRAEVNPLLSCFPRSTTSWELEEEDCFYYILFVRGSVTWKTLRILSWKLCQCSPGSLLTCL